MTELDQRLLTLGDHLDAERAASNVNNQHVGAVEQDIGSAPTKNQNRPTGRRVALSVAALTVLIAGLAGATVILRSPSDRPIGIAVSDASKVPGQAAGLFPAGDEAAVVEAGFATARAVAADYLDSRLDSSPFLVEIYGTVGETRPVGDNKAVVEFSIQAANDTGDGYIFAERVGPAPGAWVVISAAIISLDVTDLSYTDGSLSGTIESAREGKTTIAVYDALSSELIMSTELDQSQATDFRIDQIDADAIAIRFWNTGDLATQEGPTANFAEIRLYDGDKDIDGGWAPLAHAADQSMPNQTSIDQTATVTMDDCRVRVRVYNASPRAGLATALTNAIDLTIQSSSEIDGKLLPPRNAPTWDGDITALVGSNASCFDIDQLNLPDTATTLSGNLLESWNQIGLSNADSPISDEDSTTIIIVTGMQYSP